MTSSMSAVCLSVCLCLSLSSISLYLRRSVSLHLRYLCLSVSASLFLFLVSLSLLHPLSLPLYLPFLLLISFLFRLFHFISFSLYGVLRFLLLFISTSNDHHPFALSICTCRAPTAAAYSGAAGLVVLYMTDRWIGRPVLAKIPWIGDRYQDKSAQ
eukprot:m.47667 g.47667  ORF g.47667 m.47667 type:complete len:156 (+) comp12342_c0_seq3:183-650(+)